MDLFEGWSPASPGAQNQPGVHVWGATVSGLVPRLPSFFDSLSDGERERAAAFRFERHRSAYIAAHGVLHDVLARYAGVQPGTITFEIDDSGRPSFASGLGTAVDFNLSHAGDAVLVAVASGQSVGVDVEEISSLTDHKSLADRFFASEEIAEIRAAGPGEGDSAFYRCWTKKEAIVKAIGRGLSIPLDSFVVEIGARRQRVSIGGDGAFTIVDLDLVSGYAGAVAMQREDDLARWTWAPVDVDAGR